MNTPHWREIAADGLWHNNPALVQVIGLCPLLAVTGSLVNALGLGIATLAVLVLSNVSVSLVRHWVSPAIRLPVFVLVIAAMVSVVEMVMQAYTFGLYQILGIFIPLIVTNCAILGRAEAFASRQPVHLALWDGLAMGLGFLLVLVVLGALREIVGQGTLGANLHLLLGEAASSFMLTFNTGNQGALIALLPPGAFFGLALLIAGKNTLDARRQTTVTTPAAPRRVRTTGVIR